MLQRFFRTLQIVAALEVIFSASSPITFGGLADDYLDRVQRLPPAGSSATDATADMVSAGIAFDYPMAVCGRGRRVPSCYASALIYAGGNPLCRYWHGVLLQTNGRGPSSVIEAWRRTPNQIACFWAPTSVEGRPRVLIDSVQAELGIR